MKRSNRGLWVSIVFVSILVLASLVGFATGRLEPTLGLDLQGGVAVILSAPEGTGQDVMEQTLENIRNRVDAFGVGEPDIFLSGTTIEVQIPGIGNSTVEERPAELSCLVGEEDANYGCADDQELADDVLATLEVTSTPSEVCLQDPDGTELECFASRPEAKAARSLIAVEPKASATPSTSASPSESATATPSASPSEGPALPADEYCLVNTEGDELACYDSKAAAEDAKEGMELEVTERTWGVIPSIPEPAPTPTPTPSESATPSSTASATPTASPSPSGVELFAQLDRSGAEPLPNGLETEEEAQTALDAIAVQDVSVRYCVVSSAGEDLGCYLTRSAAEEQRRATGQQRLLNVIGTTARLEERPTIQLIPPGDPSYESLPLTCSTVQEQQSDACRPETLDTQTVVYLDPGTGEKAVLGPVVITGANVDSASAALIGGTQDRPVIEWVVNFELDSEGSDAFAEATTTAVSAPSPQNQIAIVVDRQVVSNPVVQDPITNGIGTISGNFTEETAKDLATVLNAGALPVELTRQSVRTVSPTLGEESLQQGIAAGIAGLVLLFLYLLVYYRLLGVVAWFGMSIWAILALALVSIAGEQFGYALTLAGVAGLVISLGITADSYIVFFERLKDEMRGGKSARTVVQPAFSRSFRTIIAADIVTGIAAAVLYLTAVSSVRGFALTLGVATALDLFVVWFFKRPTVILLARNTRMVNLRGFGLRSAAAVDHEALDRAAEVEA